MKLKAVAVLLALTLAVVDAQNFVPGYNQQWQAPVQRQYPNPNQYNPPMGSPFQYPGQPAYQNPPRYIPGQPYRPIRRGRPSICGGFQRYYPSTHVCCPSGYVLPRPLGVPARLAACCGYEVYNNLTHNCCALDVYRRDIAKCCMDHVTTNGGELTHTCCGDQSYPRMEHKVCCMGEVRNGNPMDTGCCGHETYDKLTSRCCANHTEYDPADDMCCMGMLIGLPEYNHFCCGMHALEAGGSQGCCPSLSRRGYPLQYDVHTESCCGGEVVPGGVDTHRCCGKVAVDLSTSQGCCNGKVYDILLQKCCDGQLVAGPESTSTCCGTQAIPSTSSSIQCCGGHSIYDMEQQTCCNEVVREGRSCVQQPGSPTDATVEIITADPAATPAPGGGGVPDIGGGLILGPPIDNAGPAVTNSPSQGAPPGSPPMLV